MAAQGVHLLDRRRGSRRAFATRTGRWCSWSSAPRASRSGRIRWWCCASRNCSTCDPTRSNVATDDGHGLRRWRIEHAFMLAPGRSDRGAVAAELQGVPAAGQAGLVQPERGDGEGHGGLAIQTRSPRRAAVGPFPPPLFLSRCRHATHRGLRAAPPLGRSSAHFRNALGEAAVARRRRRDPRRHDCAQRVLCGPRDRRRGLRPDGGPQRAAASPVCRARGRRRSPRRRRDSRTARVPATLCVPPGFPRRAGVDLAMRPGRCAGVPDRRDVAGDAARAWAGRARGVIRDRPALRGQHDGRGRRYAGHALPARAGLRHHAHRRRRRRLAVGRRGRRALSRWHRRCAAAPPGSSIDRAGRPRRQARPHVVRRGAAASRWDTR